MFLFFLLFIPLLFWLLPLNQLKQSPNHWRWWQINFGAMVLSSVGLAAFLYWQGFRTQELALALLALVLSWTLLLWWRLKRFG
jgi:hypothetical protein